MNGGTSPRGYTIVEVMVFLAISGVMFLLAVAFISGKQSKAEFQQGMNDINSQVQQVINSVSDGLTTFNGDYTCLASVSGISFTDSPSTNTTGSNGGCVLLGKVIQFDVKPDGGSTPNPSAYNIYTVAGRQYVAATDLANLATSFAEATPIALVGGASNTPDLTQKDTLNWGLRVTKMTNTVGGVPIDINGIGFFSDFGGLTHGGQQSGSQTVQLIPMIGAQSTTGETESDMVGSPLSDFGIDATSSYASADSTSSSSTSPDIVICFSGSANEYGTLTIGDTSANAQGQRLTTSIQISNSQLGVCQ